MSSRKNYIKHKKMFEPKPQKLIVEPENLKTSISYEQRQYKIARLPVI